MPLRAYPLIGFGTHTGPATGGKTVTASVFANRHGLCRGMVTLYVESGGTAAGATLDVRVQGAHVNSASQFTMVRCYTAVGPYANPIVGHMIFTQASTAGQESLFSDFLPPYLRAVHTQHGSAPQFVYGLYLSAQEGVGV